MPWTKRFSVMTGQWELVPPEPIFCDGYMACPEGCDSKFTVLRTYEKHYQEEHPQ